MLQKLPQIITFLQKTKLQYSVPECGFTLHSVTMSMKIAIQRDATERHMLTMHLEPG